MRLFTPDLRLVAHAQARRCRDLGLADVRLGANLFSTQLGSADLLRVVQGMLAEAGLPAQAIEITENTLVENDGCLAAPLAELRARGVGIAFDDDGTGCASLTMPKALPVTRLRIDRSFVGGIERSSKDQAIVEATARLFPGFDLDLIAEGIGTQERAGLMRRFRGEGQGTPFGRPLPGDRIAATRRASGGRPALGPPSASGHLRRTA